MAKVAKITQELERIAGEMCDKYCKYSEDLKAWMETDETEETTPACCENCPLHDLY